jgi:predicted dehydrogenase
LDNEQRVKRGTQSRAKRLCFPHCAWAYKYDIFTNQRARHTSFSTLSYLIGTEASNISNYQRKMAPPTLPVRAALIGLSSTAITSWASNAHLPGLLSPVGRSKITIKALLNSSVDAAKSAIKTYDLPSDTKAYGSPEDLAADPEIDLVICNTRVDKHYETIIPSVRAGKDVYVEWPIAAKKEHIEELVETARKTGSRIAVGLQGRWAPTVVKLRELLKGGNGELGKVLSAEVRAYGGTNDREILPTGLKYFAFKEIGGNPIVIGFGHGKYLLICVEM